MDSGSQEESHEEALARLATLLRLVPGTWVVVVAEGDLLVRGILKDLGERLAPLEVNEISFIHNEPDPLLLAESFPAEKAEAAPVLAFRHLSVVTPRVFLNLDLKREALALLPHRLVFFVSESERLQMLAQAPNFYSRLRAFFRFAPLEGSSDRERIALVPSPTASLMGSRLYRLRPSLEPISEKDRASRIRGLLRRIEELRDADPVKELTLGQTVLDLADLEEGISPLAAEEHYLEAAVHFGRADNFPAKADSLLSAGIAAAKRGELDSALEHFHQARGLLHKVHSDHLEAESLLLEVEVQFQVGQLWEPEAQLKKALELFEALDNPHGTARALMLLGRYLVETGRAQEGLSSILRTVEIFQRLDDKDELARSYHQLGEISLTLGDSDQAYRWYRQALQILEILDNKVGLASTYHQLGNVAFIRREFDQALDWYRRSLQIEQLLGNSVGMAASYLQLGVVAHERAEFDQALLWYHKALENGENSNDKSLLAAACSRLGALLTDRGEPAKAVPLTLRSLAISDGLKFSPWIDMNLSLLNRQREQLGEEPFRAILGEHLQPDSLESLLRRLASRRRASSDGSDAT